MSHFNSFSESSLFVYATYFSIIWLLFYCCYVGALDILSKLALGDMSYTVAFKFVVCPLTLLIMFCHEGIFLY